MAKTTLSAGDAALLARVRTDRQARAVLGIVAQYLRQGYEVADNASGGPLLYLSNRELKKQFKESLDENNRWAQKVYASIPDDDAPVSPLNLKKVGLALAQARETFAMVKSDADDLNRGLTGALLDMVNNWVKQFAQQLAHDATNDPMKILKWVGVGVVALTGLFVLGKLVHTVAFGNGGFGQAELLEAEREAMEIARTQGFGRRRRAV